MGRRKGERDGGEGLCGQTLLFSGKRKGGEENGISISIRLDFPTLSAAQPSFVVVSPPLFLPLLLWQYSEKSMHRYTRYMIYNYIKVKVYCMCIYIYIV